jgi:hypothetical protein
LENRRVPVLWNLFLPFWRSMKSISTSSLRAGSMKSIHTSYSLEVWTLLVLQVDIAGILSLVGGTWKFNNTENRWNIIHYQWHPVFERSDSASLRYPVGKDYRVEFSLASCGQ